MTPPTYQQLILEGLTGLPPEALIEIVDFIYCVRKRTLQPQTFAEDLRQIFLQAELRQLSRAEEAHLEEEFHDYDRLYSCE